MAGGSRPRSATVERSGPDVGDKALDSWILGTRWSRAETGRAASGELFDSFSLASSPSVLVVGTSVSACRYGHVIEL
ncbi:putative extensin [Iris pallida]|uniref:Extensin n=1 Tax=Iris pallida TaxID=29817 RepID=A0AAX6DQ79_IRIPA|nr:putative extensin [Iris pallida]